MLANTVDCNSILDHFKYTFGVALHKNASTADRFVQKRKSVLQAGRTMARRITGNGVVLARG